MKKSTIKKTLESTYKITLPQKAFEGEEDYNINISRKQLQGVLKFCGIFKEYFDDSNYGILVYKTVINYSKIHSEAYSGFSKCENLNINNFAKPCKPIPPQLVATCNRFGQVFVAYKNGYPLRSIDEK